VSSQAAARAFASICSGVVAPAMTLATAGLASSQPKASSSSVWPRRAANASSFSTMRQLRSLMNWLECPLL
jgi:hypothetical protein